jgi:predicted porin
MTSLKKLTAVLAVSLPLATMAQAPAAAPAAPPAPLYQWYGTLNLNLQWVEVYSTAGAAGRPMSGRPALSIDSSNVGIRGTAEVGHELGVVYQCETQASIDGDGAAVLVCGRNSRIGLANPRFGTLFYGNWDSPYKALAYGTKGDDPFGNTDIFDLAAIIGSPGFKTRASGGRTVGGTTGNTLASFNPRAGNSVAYHSPRIGGFQLRAQYSANEYQNRVGDIAPALYSIAANWDKGALSLGIAYERHDDYVAFAGTSAAAFAPAVPTRSTTDQGIKANAGVELSTNFGVTTIGGQFEWLQYANANPLNGQFDNFTRPAYMLGLKHRMGNHEFRARFSQAFDIDVTIKGGGSVSGADTGAINYALGYSYYLSKAAQVYAFATKLENEARATYTFATAGPAQLTATTPAGEDWTAGGDPFGAGLGIRYAF